MRRALSDLRAAVPAWNAGAWLITMHGAVRWNQDAPYWLDVEAFEELIQQGTLAALHHAVELYAGDLLVGWVDEWVLVERERLRELQLIALRRLVAHHSAQGGYAIALPLARQALGLDAMAEALHRDLIAVLYQAGDRAAALVEYDRLRALLSDELGVQPMAESEVLRDAIVRGVPLPLDQYARTSLAPAPQAIQSMPQLIGREHEMPTHPLARLRRHVAREGTVTAVAIKPLSRAAHRVLVAGLSGLEADLATPVADRLFQETAGNPFFLHEIVRGLIDAAHLVVGAGRWTGCLVEAAPVAEVPLPDSLRETITARVARLPEIARKLIRVAAVAGPVFAFKLVQRVGGLSDEQALEALEELLERGFVHEDAAEGEFAFAHQLVQEAVYGDLTAPRRVHWHRRLAETLAQTASRLPALRRQAMAGRITHHARKGENFAFVYHWAPQAAVHATQLYAYADAKHALEAASDAFEQLRRDPEFELAAGERQHIELLLKRAELVPAINNSLEEHDTLLRAAADLLARYPDERLQATYYLRQSDHLAMLSHYEQAAAAALQAFARFRDLEDCAGAARSLFEAGRNMITISQNKAGLRLQEQARDLYRAGDDVIGEAMCLSGLAWAELNLGTVELALRHLTRGLALSEQRDDKLGMARICFTLAAAWGYYHSPTQIQDFAERSVRLYQEIGLVQATGRPMLYVAEAHRLRGELARAQLLGEQVLAQAQAQHDGWLEGWTSQILGRLALGRRDPRAAEELLRHACELRQQSGEIQNQISDLTWLGRLHLTRGRNTAALELTSQATTQLASLLGEFYVWEMPDVYLMHAEALAANGNAIAAQDYLQRAYDTLMRFAAQIHDPSVTQVFLAYPANVHLVATWKRGLPAARRRDPQS